MCTTRLGIAGSRTDSRRYVGLWVGMIFKFILALIFHTLVIVAASAEVARKPTLSGTVTDAVSGQPLVGAVLYVPQLGTGIPTDADGRYSIALPAGRYRFVCSYMGYDTSATEFDIRTDMIHDVALNPKDETIEEVVVTSAHKGENLTRPEMGVQKIQSQTIRSVPVLMGETDLIKVIQLMPGVQAASEGSTGFSVRGGNPDQNLVLIDGATVYNAGHFMGFFSVFNNDAVHDVKLYKGDMPAEHGGRMASLLDVRLTEGDRQSLHGRGGVGLIASRLTVEGPLWKDRTSFIVSGRRTYYDVFLPLSSDDFVKECKIYFYDVNAKIGILAHRFFLLQPPQYHRIFGARPLQTALCRNAVRQPVRGRQLEPHLRPADVYGPDAHGRAQQLSQPHGLRRSQHRRLEIGHHRLHRPPAPDRQDRHGQPRLRPDADAPQL